MNNPFGKSIKRLWFTFSLDSRSAARRPEQKILFFHPAVCPSPRKRVQSASVRLSLLLQHLLI